MPYAKRRCTGSPSCPAVLSGSDRYCPDHAKDYEKKRGSRQQRGYDRHYDAQRRHWQSILDTGLDVRCWRPACDNRINPKRWQLGHDDNDRSIIRGPECPSCNTSAGGRKGAWTRR